MNAMDHVVIEYREELCGFISDASKDAQGFRHRFDDSDITTNDLNAMADDWARRANRMIEEEQERQAMSVAHFEREVGTYIDMGAGNRETAIRWMIDAYEEITQQHICQDPSYFNYLNGLPYNYDFKNGVRKN